MRNFSFWEWGSLW